MRAISHEGRQSEIDEELSRIEKLMAEDKKRDDEYEE